MHSHDEGRGGWGVQTTTTADDDVRPVGLVPDEVLLRCGRPGGVPSAWWTPWLHTGDAAHVAALRAAADAFLVQEGLVDEAGGLTGLLGEVAAVVRGAASAVLVEHEAADGGVARRALLMAGTAALLDTQRADVGAHELLLCSPRGAVAALVGVLDPGGRAACRTPPEVVDVAALDQLLPPARRVATTRVVRAARAGGAVCVVTVVEDDRGLAAVSALPQGRVGVVWLALDDVVDLAAALLGAAGA